FQRAYSGVGALSKVSPGPGGVAPTFRRSVRAGQAPALLVEGDGGGHVGEVADPLGEVPEELAGLDVVLLGEQAQVVGRGDGPVEDAPGLLQASLAGETLHEPEGTGHEHALLAFEPVVALVAQEEAVAVLVELGPDGVGRTFHTLVVIGDELVARQQEQRRVEVAGTEGLHERAPVAVPTLGLDLLADLVARPGPPPGGR